MSRTDARNWIVNEVVDDNSFPVCQFFYSLGLLGYTGTYNITNNSVITDKLANADSYANKTIKNRLAEGITSGSNGTTAFKKKTDTDLYRAFGGGVDFSWSVDSIDEDTGTINVKVHITDSFDFHEGGGKRDFWGEKLTSIGRKAGLSSFKIEGSYTLSVKLSSEQIEAIKAQIND